MTPEEKECYNLLVGLALDEENHRFLLSCSTYSWTISEFIIPDDYRERYDKTGIFKFKAETIMKCCKEIVDLLDIKYSVSFITGTSIYTGLTKYE